MTDKHIKRTIGIVKLIERAVVNTDAFVLIDDSSGFAPEGGQATERPSFYTKTYRMKLDWRGPTEFLATAVRFTYNYRDNWADVEFHCDSSPVRRENRRATEDDLCRVLANVEVTGEALPAKGGFIGRIKGLVVRSR
ncbi:MAG: hypothetical protein JRN35_06100 [Nitrososphaerota archaeon]|nr:hypothetical protein [Nitrososphaerota archaeon]